MKTHYFNQSIIHGKNGEDTVKKWFASWRNIQKYEDVSENPDFQQIDIDGIVWLKDGSHRTVEIKTDSYTTGNLFYETHSCVETNTIGCMERTDAQYLYYYFTGYQAMYALDMNAFREWALAEHATHPEVLEPRTLRNLSKSGKRYHHSKGFLIPLTYLEQHFPKRFWKKFDMTNWQNTAA